MTETPTHWILTLVCDDRPGIVHAISGAIVEAAGTVPQLDALGMRGDPDTGVTVLYAESSTTLTPVDELRVRALLEELLACFTAEELVRELHAGAFY